MLSLLDGVILFRQGGFFRVKIIRHIHPDAFQHQFLQIIQVRAGLVAALFRCTLVHSASDVSGPSAICPGLSCCLLHNAPTAAADDFSR